MLLPRCVMQGPMGDLFQDCLVVNADEGVGDNQIWGVDALLEFIMGVIDDENIGGIDLEAITERLNGFFPIKIGLRNA